MLDLFLGILALLFFVSLIFVCISPILALIYRNRLWIKRGARIGMLLILSSILYVVIYEDSTTLSNETVVEKSPLKQNTHSEDTFLSTNTTSSDKTELSDTELNSSTSVLELEIQEFQEFEKQHFETTQWKQTPYVDKWGTPQLEFYLTNKYNISGFFETPYSNDELCSLTIMIDCQKPKRPKVSFLIYEYDDYLIKDISDYGTSFKVYIKAGPHDYTIRGTHSGDRITFNKANSKTIIKLLSDYPSLRFIIENQSENDRTKYSFNLNDTTGFATDFEYYKEDIADTLDFIKNHVKK